MDGNETSQNNSHIINENLTVDIIRFVCSLIVISIHCHFFKDSSIQKTITGLAIPFFAITSGYYFNYASKKALKKMAIKMLVLAIIGDILMYPTMMWAQSKIDGHLSMNWRFFLFDNICLGHLWYLISIICCAVICYIMRNVLKKNIVVFLVSVIINLVFDLLSIFNIKILDSLGDYYYYFNVFLRVIIILPYFTIGILLRKYNNADIKKINLNKIFVYCVFLGWFILRWLIHKRNHAIGGFYMPLIIIMIVFEFFQQYPTLLTIDIRHAKRFRFTSMFIYLIHPLYIFFLTHKWEIPYGELLFAITVAICIVSSFFVFDVINIFQIIFSKKEAYINE